MSGGPIGNILLPIRFKDSIFLVGGNLTLNVVVSFDRTRNDRGGQDNATRCCYDGFAHISPMFYDLLFLIPLSRPIEMMPQIFVAGSSPDLPAGYTKAFI